MSRTGVTSVDGLDVEVTVRRVKRMNVRVHPPHGEVRLSVPPRTSERAVVRFVRESRAWIDHHRARILEEERVAASRPTPPARRGVSGEVWWRLGRPHRLHVVATDGRRGVELASDGRLVVRLPEPNDHPAVLALLDRWERHELRTAAVPLLDVWAARMGVSYDFLGLRRMATRWGSCVPARRRIWLNVALLPRHSALVEYVVVHELAHLREASHGPAFRALMDAHLPDWRTRRSALDAS